MTSRNSLKTPINKALLTPCRRVGLSRSKKTPKPLNLNSPALLTTPPLTKSHNTPSKPLGSDLPSPLNANKTVLKTETPLNTTRTPLTTPLAVQLGTTTPLKKQDKKKAKKLFDNAPEKDFAKFHLKDSRKYEKNEFETIINNDKIDVHNQENDSLQPSNIEEVKTSALEKEEIRPSEVHKIKNEKLVQKLKDTLNNVGKISNNKLNENILKAINKIEDKTIKNKNSLEPEIEIIPIEIVEDLDETLEEKHENKKNKVMNKPSIFRKATSSIRRQGNNEKSPLNVGKFTTSEWLEDEEFRDLKEKQFNWKELKEKGEKLEDNHVKDDSSDSDREMFTSKIASKRKRKAAIVIDSSSNESSQEKKEISKQDHLDGNSNEEFAEGPIKIRGLLDSDSDEEFSKEPIKIGSKSYKSKKTLSTLKIRAIGKNSDQQVAASKKLKKQVTVGIEKMSEAELEKYSRNIDQMTGESHNTIIKNDVDESLKNVKNPSIDLKKETKELLKEVNTIKALIEKNEQVLDNLRQAQIYRNKHDPKKLEELSNVWLNGCRLAIADLLQLLKQHGPITMKSLLAKLQIPPDILVKLNISTDDEQEG